MELSRSFKKLHGLLPTVEKGRPIELSEKDVVIHAPGFEDRTMAIVEDIVMSRGGKAILLDYRPYKESHKLKEVCEGLLGSGVDVSEKNIIEYDRFRPGDFELRLRARLTSVGAKKAVIDISTMSKLEILLVLNVCREMKLDVKILYSEAETYGPSEEEFENAREKKEIHRPSLQIFTGIHGVVRVDSLSSIAMQGQSTAAIVFMSLNDAMTQVLLNTVYPGRLLLINGRPPVHSWREEATAWIHDQVRREWEDDNPCIVSPGSNVPLPKRTVSTLDYRETVVLLIDLYWALSAGHRVLLAPAGSKLQSVGCYIVKALHPDIHIEYPSPEWFHPYYSSGIGHRWNIEFGNLNKLVTELGAEERREFLEIRR
ncbi:MAG: hypothetical protein OXQ29_26110 [Rhodospirillaceae bacterium]|nr:hypothetical protein [Rhodospirillaceae bacterium]